MTDSSEAMGAGAAAGRDYEAPDRDWDRKLVYHNDPRRKSPVLAILLSLVPGLGQAYVGYYQQAFINILTVASLLSLTVRGVGHLQPLAVVFLIFFCLFNLVDAGRRASLYNQALSGVGGMAPPAEITLPSGPGSLAGGLALVAIGLVALANTRFGYSLEWVEQWWPMVFVLMGVYLVARAVLAGRQSD